jgi:hypothetical protein
MRKNKYSKYLLLSFLIGISFFLLVFEYLHTEKNFEFENKCPICLFERTTTLFWALSAFLLIFRSLHLIVFKIYLRESSSKVSFFSHILGQRAPPQC